MYQFRQIFWQIRHSKRVGLVNASTFHLRDLHIKSQHRAFTWSQAPHSDEVRIIEVGPRDGLQNIKQFVATPIKVELIRKLAAAGLRNIEATSFVPPKWVPQLADGNEVMKQILPLSEQSNVRIQVLTPNSKGLQNAIQSRAREVVVFASATEAFSRMNQNCSVDEALEAAKAVVDVAKQNGISARGVVSCIFADPYSGPTDPSSVLYVAKRLLEMGCYEVGLGDTLGVGTPRDTESLLNILLKDIPANKLAGHFHDTYGQAVANVVKAYELGIRTFDSSVAGLGGCPYAKGARGNAATEDLAYTFEKLGVHTGIDLERLALVGEWISLQLRIPNGSRVGSALSAKRKSITEPSTTPESSSLPRKWKVVEARGEYTVSRAGNAMMITLTRARNGNAMTGSMLDGLTDLFRELAQDNSVFQIILAAEGKFFCTGMDLSGGTNTSDISAETSYYSKVADLFSAIDNAPQTTLAMIDGPCFGGGVGLGFACDVRLVSSLARWTLSEIKLGLSPAIISKLLVREWGVPFAREAILSGREISPNELHRIGAVHGIFENSSELNSSMEAYLDKLSYCAPRSAAACKQLVRLGWTGPAGEELEVKIKDTFENMMVAGSEGEFGIRQFRNKQKRIDWGQFWGQRAKI